MSRESKELLEAFKDLLRSGSYSSQKQLLLALKNKGFKKVSQPKISRMLAKCQAIRILKDKESPVYSLPTKSEDPLPNSPIKDVVVSLDHNDVLVVVKTSPGGAKLIGHILDKYKKDLEILGTLAGDDTILIVPKKGTTSEALHSKIKVKLQLN